MGEAIRFDRFSIAADPESMAARVLQFAPASDAEALKLLRTSFPDCPLRARVRRPHLPDAAPARPGQRLKPEISLPHAIVDQERRAAA